MLNPKSFRSSRNRPEGHWEAPSAQHPAPSVPDHFCLRCPSCKEMVFESEVEAKNRVCPSCGHHFRLSARERVALLCDEGSFEEWDAGLASCDPLDFPDYPQKLHKSRLATGEKEGVVCGAAAIGGFACAFFAMEGGFMMGSMGSVVGEKITRLFERAAEARLPVVGATVSGGARMQEGILSLMQMAKTSGAVKRHSDAGLLYIALLTDPTSGGVTASFAMEADILLSEPGALIAFAGPRVIEQTIRQKLPKNFQRAEYLLEHGFLDAVIPRHKLKRVLTTLLRLHTPPQNAPQSGPQAETDAPAGGKARPAGAAYEILQTARAADHPSGRTAIEQLCSEFAELRGDRRFGDDAAIIGGVGRIGGMSITVIAQEKGADLKERSRRNFGMAHPEGYRKALRLMKQAEKFGRPVLCLVDTSGAFCGIEAEQRGQGQAIAENLMEMMALRVPVVSIILGEGGSGGALALAVADRVWMMENSVYSVISPEGCSSILWRDAGRVREAAACLKITPADLLGMGVIERIVPEVPRESVAPTLKAWLAETYRDLEALSPEALCEARYRRFRGIGTWREPEPPEGEDQT